MLVDLHTHILPGIDDGSQSSKMSYEMLLLEKKQGVSLTVFTPHFYEKYTDIPTFLEDRKKAFEHLKKRILEFTDGKKDMDEAAVTKEEKKEDLPNIIEGLKTYRLANNLPITALGAEVAFYSGISEDKDIEKLCLEGTKTLLLEMPFTNWTHHQMEEVETLVLTRGLNIILAHPERFLYNKENEAMIYQMMKLPVGIQVNAESLKHFTTKRKAKKLLKEAEIPLLGSDCHNVTTRKPNLDPGLFKYLV